MKQNNQQPSMAKEPDKIRDTIKVIVEALNSAGLTDTEKIDILSSVGSSVATISIFKNQAS